MSVEANVAVAYVLRRIKDDPRLAYYFGSTEALALLTKAHALDQGLDPAVFHTDFEARLSTERPRCRSGECHRAAESAS